VTLFLSWFSVRVELNEQPSDEEESVDESVLSDAELVCVRLFMISVANLLWCAGVATIVSRRG